MEIDKWDKRFMERAKSIAQWSKDPDHKVGAVIVNPEFYSVSEGYNGPPHDVQDKGLERHIELMRTLHAELNAILNSNTSLKGYTMYVYPFMPCAQCAAAIIQKGITKVVYYEDRDLKNWKASQKEAIKMFEEAGVYFLQYSS